VRTVREAASIVITTGVVDHGVRAHNLLQYKDGVDDLIQLETRRERLFKYSLGYDTMTYSVAAYT
jgi:hypothetical protein